VPVATHVQAGGQRRRRRRGHVVRAGHQRGVPGRQLGHPVKRRGGRDVDPVGEDLGQPLRVEPTGQLRPREQGLDLRGEQQDVAGPGDEQRPDAETVAGQEERSRLAVPDGEGELAVEPLDAAVAPLLVGVDDDLGVAAGAEDVAEALELGGQLGVVEDLAVEDDPVAAVLGAERLLAAGQVDDGQPGMAEERVLVAPGAELVGPAVPQGADHALGQALGQVERAGQAHRATDAAHGKDRSFRCRTTTARPARSARRRRLTTSPCYRVTSQTTSARFTARFTAPEEGIASRPPCG